MLLRSLLCFLFVSVSHVSFAGVITQFGNRAVFEAAVGPVTVENFTDTFHFPISTVDSFGLPAGILNSNTNLTVASGTPIQPGDIKAGVTYSTKWGPGNFFNIDAGGGFDGGFLDSLRPGSPLLVTFDQPVTGFGFDTNFLMGTAFDVTINFLSDPSISLTETIAPQFFGYKSNQRDIQSVFILGNDAGVAFALDNFTFTQPITAVPEPNSLLVFASLGAVGLVVRKRYSIRSKRKGTK